MHCHEFQDETHRAGRRMNYLVASGRKFARMHGEDLRQPEITTK